MNKSLQPSAPVTPLASSARFEGRTYRRYALFVLASIYVINHLDRQIVNILAEPIKRDLQLADWQIGIMGGLAFTVFYSILGLPIARLAERRDRPVLIAASVAVWSGFTVLCGLAQNFIQLVAARVGVGVGEAGCTPPAHSLIAEFTPPAERSAALGIYGMGASIGALLGMVFGGLVADAYGWRTAFFVAGAPGLLLALIAVFTLREPRRLVDQHLKSTGPRASLGDALRLLRTKRSYLALAGGSAVKALILSGKAVFVASFFLRNHAEGLESSADWLGGLIGLELKPLGFLGLALGLTSGIAGMIGMWFGGKTADFLGKRDPKYYMLVPAFASVATVPAFIGVIFAPTIPFALVMLAIHGCAAAFSYGPTYSVAMSVVPSHMRATSSAIMLMAGNLIGMGFGPLAIGLLSDLFAQQMGVAEGLRSALFVAAWIGMVPALFFWFGSRSLKADLESDTEIGSASKT